MNIEALSALLLRLSPLKIDEKFCSHLITPLSTCSKCQQVCPQNCITISNAGIAIGECLTCGQCITACPNDVFKLENTLTATHNTIILTCTAFISQFKKLAKQPQITHLNCFHQFYPELALNLLAHQQRLIFFYDAAKCSQCFRFQISEFQHALEAYQSVWPDLLLNHLEIITTAEALQPLLDELSQDDCIDGSRRQMLQNIFHSAKNLPVKIASDTLDKYRDEKPPLDFSVPLGISVRKHYLKEACHQKVPADPDALLPFQALRSADCLFCGVCSKLCPTRALQLQPLALGQAQLLYTPHLCSHCGTCITLCFTRGLHWDQALTARDLTEQTVYRIAKGLPSVPRRRPLLPDQAASER